MSQYDTPDWFPFYVYVFLGDELVQSMTLEQIGAYTLLLCAQWINGSIPADIPALARMLRGRTTAEMEILWQGIGGCFTDTGDGRLVQKRLATERDKAIRRLAGNRKGGTNSKASQPEVEGKSTSSQSESTRPRPLCSVSVNTTQEGKTNTGAVDEFRDTYPRHRLDDYGVQCFLSADNQAEILTRLRAAVVSDEWQRDGGRYVPKASKWIMDGAPAPAVESAPRKFTDLRALNKEVLGEA